MSKLQRLEIYNRSIKFSKVYIWAGIQLVSLVFFIIAMIPAIKSFSEYDSSFTNALASELPKIEVANRLWFFLFLFGFLLTSYFSFVHSLAVRKDHNFLWLTFGIFSFILLPYYAYLSYKNEYFKEYLFSLKRDEYPSLAISHSHFFKSIFRGKVLGLFWNTLLFYITLLFSLIGMLLLFFSRLEIKDNAYELIIKILSFENLISVACSIYLLVYTFSFKSSSYKNHTQLTTLASYVLFAAIFYWSCVYKLDVEKQLEPQAWVAVIWNQVLLPLLLIAFSISSVFVTRQKPINSYLEYIKTGMGFPLIYVLMIFLITLFVPFSLYGATTNINPSSGLVPGGSLINIATLIGLIASFYVSLTLFYYGQRFVAKHSNFELKNAELL
ncbi:MAG: hypothetical protein ACRC4M_04445 [Mycoplasma sp.]